MFILFMKFVFAADVFSQTTAKYHSRNVDVV